ncbi:MAG: MBL fold metallo-hydrolase [Deltaproteobacteria bacterium]|nr:MBL fold metallo-hydrolase [Deltaproteobacteria bacterium]
MPRPTLQFLGATETVTGSRSLLRRGGKQTLIDCGLFQGFKHYRVRNRAPLQVPPGELDAVVLTHAHLDHSGWLPRLIMEGYSGRVHASAGTVDLCGILLPDSGHIQEEEASRANEFGYTKHRPARPLYTEADARRALTHLEPVGFEAPVQLPSGLELRLHRAGHILGASMVRLSAPGLDILFSGDLGRPDDPLMGSPARVRRADFLVLESTYGNRQHPRRDPEGALGDIIRRTAARGGHVIIPAFAVGRTQRLLYHLRRLRENGAIPPLPIYLDSPLARDATSIFRERIDDHLLSTFECHAVCSAAKIVRSPDESRALDALESPAIIIAGSGMATGGRVLHHIARYGPEPQHTIVFTGFQAGGTRGAQLVGGGRTVKIFGQVVPIRAEVEVLDMLSAHADADEIIGWLRGFEAPPRCTFLQHGEPEASDTLRRRIEQELGWRVHVPYFLEQVTLDV